MDLDLMCRDAETRIAQLVNREGHKARTALTIHAHAIHMRRSADRFRTVALQLSCSTEQATHAFRRLGDAMRKVDDSELRAALRRRPWPFKVSEA